MSTIDEAADIYAERGIEQLLLKLYEFTYWRASDVTQCALDRFWNVRGGTQQFSVDGITADFDAHTANGGGSVRRRMKSEFTMLQDVIGSLRPDDVFYDVGANVGSYSAFASQVCSRTICFEPHPANYEQLRRNIEHNGGRADTFQVALSNSDGEVAFDAQPEVVGYGTGQIGSGSRTVRAARGDSIVANEDLPAPDVVKVDVEGAEALVIEGMKQALSHCRKFYCEVHLGDTGFHGSDATQASADVLTQLVSMGFDISIVNNRGNEIQIVGERRVE